MTDIDEGRLLGLLEKLDLEEKVLLLTGRDFWTTHRLEKIGLRRILVSDGPSGVRGEVWDERSPSLNLPSATALSSSWSVETAARYGAVAAAEARRKDVDVVLGPTINLHRSPLGGRHFEAFSEDPVLTADLAAAYVAAVQENGVGATPKHYVANDFETDRFTADVRVDDRALRELYLLAFERAIVESRAWLVMSAYNSINGATATENELLETPLNSEWGFDGVVISDWTAVRSVESAKHSQDLVMPGPDGPWGEALVAAVRSGDVEESAIDRKVLRLLRLAARVGALEGFDGTPVRTPEDGVAFTREAEVDGIVLVENDGVLPLAAPARIAVIGHNARQARTQGGGSATVIPASTVAPLEGIRARYPDAEVTYSLGAVVQEGIAEFAPQSMRNPATDGQGARVRFLDADGAELFAEDRFASALVYFGGDAPIGAARTFEFHTVFTPEATGPIGLGFSAVGTGRIFVDGELRAEATTEADGTDLGAAFLAPPSVSTEIDTVAGTPIDVRIEFERAGAIEGMSNAMSITIGTEPAVADPDALIAEAAEAARAAEVAVVVVGTNSRVESEGYDRSDLLLPGRQDDLVRAVVAANPRTIVLVNSGSPVELPWRNEVAALALTWFGGQEYGNAVADVLSGDREPGGRLPTTWPAAMADVPVIDVTPVDGTVRYDEGIHIGYRAWLRSAATPAYPFGFGLGYTSWAFGEASVSAFGVDDAAVVEVPVRNTGDRAGKHVVQVYASRSDSAVDRPVRWLVGFTVVRVEAGAEATAAVRVPRRALAHWADGWVVEPGAFTLAIGSSVVHLPVTATIEA